MTQHSLPGKVYLIGAGPGDPDLITVKGRDALALADVIVYDSLVNPRLLRLAKAGAKLIFAGKRAGQPSMKQEAINALLVRLAREGKTVARLKGGDPFVFGRGGEEAQALRSAGLAFEVVPGVSSAIGAAAYAGIPVTHRDYVSSFTVITGHEDPGRAPEESRLDWAALTKAGGTLVFLMGLSRLGHITSSLMAAGLTPSTPVALVQAGTTWQQRTVTADLSTIAEAGRQAGIKSPAITIVGQVVGLRQELQWFDLPQVRPLLGKRIVVAGQAGELTARLEELGAWAIEFPPLEELGPGEPTVAEVVRWLKEGEVDLLCFANDGAVQDLAAVLTGATGQALSELLGQTALACLEPAGLAAVQQLGLGPMALEEAEPVRAIAGYFLDSLEEGEEVLAMAV